jgi:GH24 family phage-related lysozyme (muramidase)
MMMLEYNKVGNKVNEGLTKRRKAELDLFTK